MDSQDEKPVQPSGVEPLSRVPPRPDFADKNNGMEKKRFPLRSRLVNLVALNWIEQEDNHTNKNEQPDNKIKLGVHAYTNVSDKSKLRITLCKRWPFSLTRELVVFLSVWAIVLAALS